MFSVFDQILTLFVKAYIALCGGSLYTLSPQIPTDINKKTASDTSPPKRVNKWRQFPALILLAIPFYALVWFIEPFVTKYFRFIVTIYCFGVLFFIAAVDRRARHREEEQGKI